MAVQVPCRQHGCVCVCELMSVSRHSGAETTERLFIIIIVVIVIIIITDCVSAAFSLAAAPATPAPDN